MITLSMAYPGRDPGPADWFHRLAAMGACTPALKWAAKGRFTSWQACWDACQRVLWMEWVMGSIGRHEDGLELWRAAFVEMFYAGPHTCTERGDRCTRCHVGAIAARALFPVAPPLPEVRK